jgi:transitional endoplasmic reticulum ATPase
MFSVYEIPLSLTTLLVALALPFSYYGYHARYWYDDDKKRLFDFVLQAFSVVCVILLGARMYGAVQMGERDQIQLVLLHLGIICLTFLAIAKGKRMGEGHSVATPVQSAEDSFAPEARNAEVESIAWDDLIIADSTKQELLSVIDLLKNPKTAKDYGIALPKGILFNGPPGTGKTTIAKAVATMAGLNFFVLRANEVVSKWVGESEKNLTRLFDAARKNSPAVVFIDEIDSLGKKRSDSNAAHSDNLLNHLLQLIDGVIKTEGVYVIAATNRADLVDEALRRAGRLNRVIEIPLPDSSSRRKLFGVYSRNLRIASDIDLDLLAKVTEGNSGADIKAMCNQAGLMAFQREQGLPEAKRTHLVTSADIDQALSLFEVEDDIDLLNEDKQQSSAPQPLNGKVEKITWEDLIVDEGLKQELRSVIQLLRDPSTAERYGIKVPKGILLNGPPGTGKTTLAKVVANEASLSFFVLQANEVISKWVGESEKNLTRLFQAAAKHAPSIIFIDEIDAIAKNRAEGNAQHADNLLNHLLQLIDGVVAREGVYVIGATNRADLVDPALKRGGRLNKVIEVPLPSYDARIALFGMYLSKLPLSQAVDIHKLAAATEGKCAADIKEICNQAGLNAFKRESLRGSREYSVTPADLDMAVDEWVRGRHTAV